MAEDLMELELCCQVFAQVLGVETDEKYFSELLERAKVLLFDLPEGWEVVTGQSDLDGIPMFFNAAKQFSQWNHPLEEQHTDTINKLRNHLNQQNAELIDIQTNTVVTEELDTSTLVVSESPVVQNLNFVSEIEIIFAQLMGIDTSEPNAFQLIFLAKELLYSLPEGWEVVSGQSDLGIIPYFFDTTTGQSFWTHPFEDECIQILDSKRVELNGGRTVVNTIEEGEEEDGSQMTPQKSQIIGTSTSSGRSPREDSSLVELTELDILFAHVLGVDVDTEPHAMELCYLAKALLYELPDSWEISVSVSEEMGGAAVPIFYDHESQASYWTHPLEASHRQRIDEARVVLREQQRVEDEAVNIEVVSEQKEQPQEQVAGVVEAVEPPVVLVETVEPSLLAEIETVQPAEVVMSVLTETTEGTNQAQTDAQSDSELKSEAESVKLNYVVAEDGSVDIVPVEEDKTVPPPPEAEAAVEVELKESIALEIVAGPGINVEAEAMVGVALVQSEKVSFDIPHEIASTEPEPEPDLTVITVPEPEPESVVMTERVEPALIITETNVIEQTMTSPEDSIPEATILVDQTAVVAEAEHEDEHEGEEREEMDLEKLLRLQLTVFPTENTASPERIVDYLQSENFSGVGIDQNGPDVNVAQSDSVEIESENTTAEQLKAIEIAETAAKMAHEAEILERERLEAAAFAAEIERRRVCEEEAVKVVFVVEVDSLYSEGVDLVAAETAQRIEVNRLEVECAEKTVSLALTCTVEETLNTLVEIVVDTVLKAAEDLARRERIISFAPAPLELDAIASSPFNFDAWLDDVGDGEMNDLNHFALPLSARDIAVGASKPVTPFVPQQAVEPLAFKSVDSVKNVPSAVKDEIPLEIITTPSKRALGTPSIDPITPISHAEGRLVIQAPWTGGDSVHSAGQSAGHSAQVSVKSKQSLPGPVDALLHQRIIKVKTDYLKMLRSNKVTDSKLSVVSTSPNKQEHSASESEDSPFRTHKQQQLKGTLFQDLVPDFTSSPARNGQFKRLAPMEPICGALPSNALPSLNITQSVSKSGMKWHLLGSYDIHKEAVRSRQVIVHLVTTDSFGTILIDPRDNFLDSQLEAEMATEKQEKERMRTAASHSSHSLMSSTGGAFERHGTASNVHNLSMKPELIIGRMKSTSEKTVKIRIRRDTGRMQWIVETDDNAVRKIVKRHRKKGKVENNMLENSSGNTVKRITKHVTPAPTAETLTEAKSFGLISKIPAVDLSKSLPFRKDRESRGDSQQQRNDGSGGESPPRERIAKPRSRALQRGSNNNREEQEERVSELKHSRSEASGILRQVQSSEGPLRLPNIGRNIAST